MMKLVQSKNQKKKANENSKFLVYVVWWCCLICLKTEMFRSMKKKTTELLMKSERTNSAMLNRVGPQRNGTLSKQSKVKGDGYGGYIIVVIAVVVVKIATANHSVRCV